MKGVKPFVAENRARSIVFRELPAILTQRRTEFGKAIRKEYESHKIHLKRQEMREWIPKNNGLSNTISTVVKDNILMETNQEQRKNGIPAEMLHLDNLPDELKGKKVYIRKLTPRECFRLMDVSEEYIDKMMLSTDRNGKPIISRSQLYKLAGNSIVVSCMEYMFENLFFPDETSNLNFDENGQLTFL